MIRRRVAASVRLAGLVLVPLTGLLGGGLAVGHGLAAAAGLPYVPVPAVRFAWPIPPPHPVLRPFQPPLGPYGPGHRGVDLGGTAGEAVFAAGDGLVLYAGPLADRSLVSIEHRDGLRTTYEPVDPSVRVGQYVSRGQLIGHLQPGHAGCPLPAVPPPPTGPAVAATPTRACLHWGVHRDHVYLDPLRLVLAGHIRLLPWPPTDP